MSFRGDPLRLVREYILFDKLKMCVKLLGGDYKYLWKCG